MSRLVFSFVKQNYPVDFPCVYIPTQPHTLTTEWVVSISQNIMTVNSDTITQVVRSQFG